MAGKYFSAATIIQQRDLHANHNKYSKLKVIKILPPFSLKHTHTHTEDFKGRATGRHVQCSKKSYDPSLRIIES